MKTKLLTKNLANKNRNAIHNIVETMKNNLKISNTNQAKVNVLDTSWKEIWKLFQIIKPILNIVSTEYQKLVIEPENKGWIREESQSIKIKQLEKEVKELKDKLNKKNQTIFNDLKSKIEHSLDLDSYNITSDDFRSRRNHSQEKSLSKYRIPKLDFKKIFEWRDKANLIKNNDTTNLDIDDEEGVQKESKKLMITGSCFKLTSIRDKELKDKKQYIIKLMDQAYQDIWIMDNINDTKQPKLDMLIGNDQLKDSLS